MESNRRRTIVVVGGVAGGAGAAAKARRTDERADIVVFERGPYVSFANCGLPYYVGGEIESRDDLLLQSPESLWNRFRIKVHVRHEVLSIDRAARTVEVEDLAAGRRFTQAYDALVLAPGAGAIVPALEGLPADNVFTLKTVPDADLVRGWIERRGPKRAVVIGAGFIGLEAAEALKKRGLEVTIVEMLPQVLPPLDADAAVHVARHLQSHGLELILGDGLKAFQGAPAVDTVVLQSGRSVPADLVILSIGVRPELKLAREAGLTIGDAGGIAVDDRQRTSDPNIYAAGDATEVLHLVTGRRTRVPLAGPANKEGRVAGANAAGGDLRFPGALGTAVVGSLGITAAKTGLSEREALKENIPHFVSWTHNADHAGYYPGGALMHVKLIVETGSGRLLGAQIVGERGVDKRIDVLATALHSRMTVADLENLDLAYAPPYSSAKDPAVMAGMAAADIHRGEVAAITCEALRALRRGGANPQVIDVRTLAERRAGGLPDSLHIPVDELRDRLGELDPAKETVVYCRVGFRGYLAARILKQNGFGKVSNLTGGMMSCPEDPA